MISIAHTGVGTICNIRQNSDVLVKVDGMKSIDLFGETLTLVFLIMPEDPGQRLLLTKGARHEIEVDFTNAGIGMKLHADVRFERLSRLEVDVEAPITCGVDFKVLEADLKFLA